ncbi:MAG: TlpA family protein disulfide reductase [Chitinophagaceae bacterium]|nr:MAG: TlpA family protein disulfide reductase [Chitinophagaceae bacterium]
MMLRNVQLLTALLFLTLSSTAQPGEAINNDLREMNKLKDPGKAVEMKNKIVKKYSLDSARDRELFDILNGTVALTFIRNNDTVGYGRYTGLIANKFNQTSMMNMAATELLQEGKHYQLALKIAEETISKYKSFKDDPSAMPAHFKPEDWSRFMSFAQYPYYDTYAHALYKAGDYKEALKYQQMAFSGKPEEGMPTSVERYAHLLALNGNEEGAKDFLLKVAELGRLNKAMSGQLQKFYAQSNRKDKTYDQFLDSLQARVKENMKDEFRKTMLNKTAPHFTLRNLQGKEVSLSDYKGKVVILDLWATWCAPCIASFPAMQSLVNKHPEVEFLFIAVQERGGNVVKRLRNFMEKHKYTFHVLVDEPVKKGAEEYKILHSYLPEGIPAKYFIDKNGMLQFTSQGFETDAELVNEVEMIISILQE